MDGAAAPRSAKEAIMILPHPVRPSEGDNTRSQGLCASIQGHAAMLQESF